MRTSQRVSRFFYMIGQREKEHGYLANRKRIKGQIEKLAGAMVCGLRSGLLFALVYTLVCRPLGLVLGGKT